MTKPETPQPSWPRRLWRILRAAIFIYLGTLVLLAFLENSMIYLPSRYPDGEWNLSTGVEDAWFTSADGTKLHGWYMPVENPRAVVLFSHGNGGNLSHRSSLLEEFRKLRVSAMLYDYRGYGRSEGRPNEAGVLADARAARAWLAKQAGVKENEIVQWGESLGGGVAVDLATEGARGLILENTFTSLPDAAAHHYSWVPVRQLMRNRFDSISKIARCKCPLLQVHGTGDTIVPYALGQELFKAANEPKKFLTFREGNHVHPNTPEFFDSLNSFFDKL